METLSETEWDVVISGTGLQQSLLALALSRSDKKVLHVDGNEYYGGPEAAFSLQEVEEWTGKINPDTLGAQFSDASFCKPIESNDIAGVPKLSSSRAYTLTLSPQIIYSKSKLLSQLVSSKVYRQLEFQAVGNWWMYTAGIEGIEPATSDTSGMLKRIPNGREDVFSDRSIDVRAKRGLMKFLKFVVNYENQTEVWLPYAETPLVDFLSSQFQLPLSLQTVILALTLSMDLPSRTYVGYSLPRVSRHLTSIGVFGPGFGAVLPKWGGGSEIAQVACRAGAVGGGVYILGTDVEDSEPPRPGSIIDLRLTNGERIRTKSFVKSSDCKQPQSMGLAIAKTTAIVSSDLSSLFISTVEGGPTAAVSVIVFPSNSLIVEGDSQAYPVYIMAHSSDTGECPAGQCVLYASTYGEEKARLRLDAAISALLSAVPSADSVSQTSPVSHKRKVIFSFSYDQRSPASQTPSCGKWVSLDPTSLDLAFDDSMLDSVEKTWRLVNDYGEGNQGEIDSQPAFMVFEEREQIGAADDYDD